MTPEQSNVDGAGTAQPDSDGLAAAFDGGPTAGTAPYVRLIPPAGEVATEAGARSPDGSRSTAQGGTMFDQGHRATGISVAGARAQQ